jgi:peptidoglycan hydrolase-like protein with peptidoglycan-binding domain
MKKIIISIIAIAILFSGSVSALAQDSTSTQNAISLMLQQIAGLQAQIQALQGQLKQAQEAQKQTAGELKEAKQEMLQLSRQLKAGMRGDDIKMLQEFLATDPDIYPEGLITGYFGFLTQKAVKKFQAKMGVEQVGNVGPKTMSKINELLTEGAGNSGKVPPGLLIAPGIQKKIAHQAQPIISEEPEESKGLEELEDSEEPEESEE